MKKSAALLALIFLFLFSKAQEPANKEVSKVYRESAPKINDLVHTKLDVKFDYTHSYLMARHG